ncbi:MAG TPA: hypothetical protein VND19_22580 [Acetobacteraceae bacterium]|nr:hypothetical protein [Acetobacteraceae bacterium]
MCERCDAPPLAALRPGAALIARARAIEAGLPGERVTEAAFAVFFGARGGAIPWPQYQRLLRCRDAAAANLPRGPLRCEAG